MGLNAELLKIKEKYEQQLLKIKGVTGVGLNHSILIYVERREPKLLQFLPTTIEGVPVRVIETGKIVPLSLLAHPIPVAHAMYQARTDRIRPPVGGISCGHPQVTAGTLACAAKDKETGEILGLSNNHVIALDWGTEHIGKKGDNVLQPGPYDGGLDPGDKIGELDRWIPVTVEEENLIDAAAFRSDILSDEIIEVGKPSNTINPYEGLNIKMSGRTSGLVFSKLADVHATIQVEGWGGVTYKDQAIAIPAIANPGDSGSWCGSMNDETVGLLHAGSTEISVICKGLNVERMLNLEIFPPGPLEYVPWHTMLGVWASGIGIPFGLYQFYKMR